MGAKEFFGALAGDECARDDGQSSRGDRIRFVSMGNLRPKGSAQKNLANRGALGARGG